MPLNPLSMTYRTTYKSSIDGAVYLSGVRVLMKCPDCGNWYDCDSMCINLLHDAQKCVLCMQEQGIPWADYNESYNTKIGTYKGWTI